MPKTDSELLDGIAKRMQAVEPAGPVIMGVLPRWSNDDNKWWVVMGEPSRIHYFATFREALEQL